MEGIKWEEANINDAGITTIAFDEEGRIVGYNGILKGEKVLHEGKEYTIVTVSRLGDFGLSETGNLPYCKRVLPSMVIKK